MKRRDPTLLAALLIALAVHLLALRTVSKEASKELGWWLRAPVAAAWPTAKAITQPPPHDQIGEANGLGLSINSSPGNVPMQSALVMPDQEQAMMSQDPSAYGPPDRTIAQAMQAGSSSRQNSNSPAKAAEANLFAAQESALAAPQGPRTDKSPAKLSDGNPTAAPSPPATDLHAKPSDAPAAEDVLSSGPAVVKPPSKNAASSSDSTAAASSPNQPAARPDAGPTGSGAQSSSAAGGNPMPQGDFESSPVTTIAADFRSGKIQARSGRKMITRWLPRLSLAAIGDLMTLENPSIVLHVTIDASGNVTDVRTIHSSGSDNVDLPWERAVSTWWFEPKKDPASGRPIPDAIDLEIHYI